MVFASNHAAKSSFITVASRSGGVRISLAFIHQPGECDVDGEGGSDGMFVVQSQLIIYGYKGKMYG